VPVLRLRLHLHLPPMVPVKPTCHKPSSSKHTTSLSTWTKKSGSSTYKASSSSHSSSSKHPFSPSSGKRTPTPSASSGHSKRKADPIVFANGGNGFQFGQDRTRVMFDQIRSTSSSSYGSLANVKVVVAVSVQFFRFLSKHLIIIFLSFSFFVSSLIFILWVCLLSFCLCLLLVKLAGTGRATLPLRTSRRWTKNSRLKKRRQKPGRRCRRARLVVIFGPGPSIMCMCLRAIFWSHFCLLVCDSNVWCGTRAHMAASRGCST
jgi:hypothetical protein